MQFGKFNELCKVAPLPLCNVIEPGYLNGPNCYARGVEINGILIFQPATVVMQIVSLIMTIIMIYNIKKKYTAVGRKEMVIFFYLYMLMVGSEFLVISGLIQVASSLYPFFVAGYYASMAATIFCLMLNGFLGFQFAEDGTFWSLWSIRMFSFIIYSLVYYLSIGTFMNWGLSKSNPIVLWIFMYLIQGLAILIYATLQIILVVNTLSDLWPIGNIILGLILFTSGQMLLHIYSSKFCDVTSHYMDGMTLSVISTLLGVMMIYKYWDSITKEDLEFSVSNNQIIWEVKDLPDFHQLNEKFNQPPSTLNLFSNTINSQYYQP